VGNIFQLGIKYSETMGMRYSDESGDQQVPIMGCYGIGVGRLAASVCEVSRDDKGPIWPISIAPWEVHICALRADDKGVRCEADKLYAQLQSAGLEVIYDDRSVAAGFMFSDADLLGVPIRVVVSPRNLAEGVIELSARDKSVSEKVPLSGAVEAVVQLKAKLFNKIKEDVPQ
jgi:prolyl-tRNA synthetase